MADSRDLKIYQQIEAAADTYQPGIYDLLTFYHALATEPDLLDDQFYPVPTRGSTRSAKDGKLFAVGLIPPASSVTSRVLDRSASVNSLITTDYDALITENPDVSSSSTGDIPGETGGIGTSTPVPNGPTSTTNTDFWSQYVAMCNRLGCQPEELAHVIQSESGWDPSKPAIRNGRPVAKGLIQLTRATAIGLGLTAEQWDNFNLSATEQLPYIEKYFKGRAKGKNAAELKAVELGGYNNPDKSLYSSYATSPQYKNAEFQRKAYEQNKGLDRPPPPTGTITVAQLARAVARHRAGPQILGAIDKAKSGLGMEVQPEPVKEPAPPAPVSKWVDSGSQNASEAAKVIDKTAKTTLLREGLSTLFLEKQNAQITALRKHLQQMAETPPLRLLVNPSSFKLSLSKLISYDSWGRNGHIVEHWGENQDKIEGSGKVSAFYSLDMLDANGPGLTRSARQFSAAYQNLLSLWLIYKNNGGIYLDDPIIGASGAHHKNLTLVGSVYLYYDDILYIGSFDNFSLTESDTSPFTLEYSFSFTVRAWYLLDHLDDPQYTYGKQKVSSLNSNSVDE